jgi:hypothetical protein
VLERAVPLAGSRRCGACALCSKGQPEYSVLVKRLRTFLERLPGGHRPPTGPLTTSEAAEAETLRQETLAKNDERIKREQQKEAGRESN